MTTELPEAVRRWRSGGTMVRTRAGEVFVHATPGAGPTLLFLHGYPSSSFDWRHVIAELPGRSVLALDFLGFGLSRKPRNHDYSLFEQADIVEEIVAGHRDGPVHLVAHDMGTSVSTELLARDLEGRLGFDLRRTLLSNGSVILERASLRPIQRLLRGPLGPIAARLSTKRLFVSQFAALFTKAHPLTRTEADAQWALLAHQGGHRLVHRLTAYLHERVRHADRWHGAVRDWPRPLTLAWGLLDPVATVNVLDGLLLLQPNATVERLPGLGHYPQIEDPSAFAAIVRRFSDSDQ